MWKYEPASCRPGRAAVLSHVREDEDVRILGMVELVDDVRLRRPEAARECGELRGTDVLRTQDQHVVA